MCHVFTSDVTEYYSVVSIALYSNTCIDQSQIYLITLFHVPLDNADLCLPLLYNANLFIHFQENYMTELNNLLAKIDDRRRVSFSFSLILA